MFLSGCNNETMKLEAGEFICPSYDRVEMFAKNLYLVDSSSNTSIALSSAMKYSGCSTLQGTQTVEVIETQSISSTSKKVNFTKTINVKLENGRNVWILRG